MEEWYVNFYQYVQCNTGKTIITGLRDRTNRVKLSKDNTGWDFGVWALVLITRGGLGALTGILRVSY